MTPFLRADLAALAPYTLPSLPPGPLDRLDSNESALDLPLPLRQDLAAKYTQSLEAHRYPDSSHQALHQAIADYVCQSASLPAGTIGPEWISAGNGSDELIRSLLIATCLGTGQGVLVAEPTFSIYAILARTLGIPVQSLKRDSYTWEMPRETPSGVRLVFALHPNSPTGNLLTPAEVTWLRQLPPEVLVVVDEAYFEFSGDSLLGELLEHPNWLILRTLSKGFRLAGHRVGYAIAHPAIITVLEKVRLPYNLPSFSQMAALLVLDHWQEILAVVPQVITEREKLLAGLRQHPVLQVWPSRANFLYLQAPDPGRLWQQLLERGTLVRHTGGGLRISVGTRAENERTLERLAAIVAPA